MAPWRVPQNLGIWWQRFGTAARTPHFRVLQPLMNKMRLRVRDEAGGQWREVTVPRSVRALVLLNIQVGGLGADASELILG